VAARRKESSVAVKRIVVKIDPYLDCDRLRVASNHPLQSIGYEHASHPIRRIQIDVPAECPSRPDDVYWAFLLSISVDRSSGRERFSLAFWKLVWMKALRVLTTLREVAA
jgi:hypothetical protein